MDWLAKMLGLPEEFLHSSPGMGGGVIQTTCSEATFCCMLAARTQAIKRHQEQFPEDSDAMINCKLVAYCSDQAHSSMDKAANICLIKLRKIESDDDSRIRADILHEFIEEDRKNGLIPFFVGATLGTTGVCAFDNLNNLGPICKLDLL